jgi:hypothetical protein
MSRLNLEDPIIERPQFKGAMKYSITSLPDAAATLDVDMGPIIMVPATATRILTLPPLASTAKGTTFIIQSGGAGSLTVNAPPATLVATVPANGQMTFFFDGVVWRGA